MGILQTLIDGLVQGILYALVGVAFSLVYSTTHAFHVALGAIYAFAPYLVLTSIRAGIGWTVGSVATVFLAAGMGILCEELLHWPLKNRDAPASVNLVASLGMFLVLVQVTVLIWGNETQVLRPGVDRVFDLSWVRLTRSQVGVLAGGTTALSLFFLWLHRSDLGLRLRGLSDNSVLLSLLGHDVRKLRRLVFATSGVLAAGASFGTAYDVGFDPHSGLRAVLVGAIATIVGGRGSLAGAVAAGVLLGVLRGQVTWFISARWEEAASYLVLVLVLFLRPNGLFGRSLRLEEQA
jgi:branched-chain amino acid transport system permease protein